MTPHTMLLGYKQNRTVTVSPKKESDQYRVLFRDSVVQGGPGKFFGDWSYPGGKIGYLSLDIMQIQDFIAEADKLQMLRGASSIVSEILREVREMIAEQVGNEAVLFSDGGNLSLFVLQTRTALQGLRKASRRSIWQVMEFYAAVVTGYYSLKGSCRVVCRGVKDISDNLNMVNRGQARVIRPPRKDMI